MKMMGSRKLCKCGCGQEVKSGCQFVNAGHSRRGKGDSEETRERKSRARLGEKNPMYGKTHPHSVQTIERIRESSLRVWMNRDLREQMSTALSGERNPRFGKPPRENAGYAKWYDYTRKSDGVAIRVSTYEFHSCELLDELEEPDWLYTGTGKFKEHKLLLSDGRHWHPDFWIPRLGFYIDVKGYWREGDRAKLALEEYPDRVKVLLGDTYLDQLQTLLGVAQ
jgi:hypothetical protein